MQDLKQKALNDFLITAAGGWIGIHKFIQGKIGIGILYFFTGGLFYVGWIYDIIKSWKNYKGVCSAHSQSVASAPAPVIEEKRSVPDGQMNYNLFEDVSEGSVLCYEYEESVCLLEGAFDHIPGNGGKPLTFIQEPENPHDEKAVGIYLQSAKIGYIYRGTVQDMFNDYSKRGWRVIGYLNKFSVADRKATYKIGFYKPLDIMDSKAFALTKVKKKIDEFTSRNDNLSACEEGDALTVEYDGFEDSYIVFNDVYEEIGELPKSAANFITADSYKKIVGILNEIKEDENGVSVARVTVYLVK